MHGESTYWEESESWYTEGAEKDKKKICTDLSAMHAKQCQRALLLVAGVGSVLGAWRGIAFSDRAFRGSSHRYLTQPNRRK